MHKGIALNMGSLVLPIFSFWIEKLHGLIQQQLQNYSWYCSFQSNQRWCYASVSQDWYGQIIFQWGQPYWLHNGRASRKCWRASRSHVQLCWRPLRLWLAFGGCLLIDPGPATSRSSYWSNWRPASAHGVLKLWSSKCFAHWLDEANFSIWIQPSHKPAERADSPKGCAGLFERHGSSGSCQSGRFFWARRFGSMGHRCSLWIHPRAPCECRGHGSPSFAIAGLQKRYSYWTAFEGYLHLENFGLCSSKRRNFYAFSARLRFHRGLLSCKVFVWKPNQILDVQEQAWYLSNFGQCICWWASSRRNVFSFCVFSLQQAIGHYKQNDPGIFDDQKNGQVSRNRFWSNGWSHWWQSRHCWCRASHAHVGCACRLNKRNWMQVPIWLLWFHALRNGRDILSIAEQYPNQTWWWISK